MMRQRSNLICFLACSKANVAVPIYLLSNLCYISKYSYLSRNEITTELEDSAPFPFQFFRGFLSRISVTWIDHKLRNFQIIRPHKLLWVITTEFVVRCYHINGKNWRIGMIWLMGIAQLLSTREFQRGIRSCQRTIAHHWMQQIWFEIL